MLRRPLALILLIGVIGAVPATSAHAAGNADGFWYAPARTAGDRYLASAALLGDGKVVMAGGSVTGTSSALTLAQVFDPRTDGWTTIDSMSRARRAAAAVSLPDGRALFAGGESSTGVRNDSAEVYDGTLRKWAATGAMNAKRAYEGAVTLSDGRVLVVGGAGPAGKASGAEVWSPAGNQWTLTQPVQHLRQSPAVARLADGRVLVAGGYEGGDLASAEIYDPASDTWTATGSMGEARNGAGASLLPDGTVLVAGGHRGSEPIRTAEIFDPATGTWSRTGDLNVPRGDGAVMTRLADGRPVMTGGLWWAGAYWQYSDYSRTAEIYDAASRSWSQTKPMAAGRYDHIAVGLNDGSLLVAGGYYADDLSERFVPRTAPTQITPPPAAQRHRATRRSSRTCPRARSRARTPPTARPRSSGSPPSASARP